MQQKQHYASTPWRLCVSITNALEKLFSSGKTRRLTFSTETRSRPLRMTFNGRSQVSLCEQKTRIKIWFTHFTTELIKARWPGRRLSSPPPRWTELIIPAAHALANCKNNSAPRPEKSFGRRRCRVCVCVYKSRAASFNYFAVKRQGARTKTLRALALNQSEWAYKFLSVVGGERNKSADR